MSACDQFLPNLCAWLDGELDGEESAAMEAHVAQCASCRALAAQYRRLDAAMAAVEPPAGLHEHMMRGVSAHHSPKAKRRFAFGSATAVAAAAAALLLAVGTGLISLPQWSSASQAADSAAPMAAADVSLAAKSADANGSGDEWQAELSDSFTLTAEAADAPDMDTSTGSDGSAVPSDSSSAEAPSESLKTEQVPLETEAPAADSAGESAAEAPASSDSALPQPLPGTSNTRGDTNHYASSGNLALSDGLEHIDDESIDSSSLIITSAEQAELHFAAGDGPFVWTIHGYTPETLPYGMRELLSFIRVGTYDLYIATMEEAELESWFYDFFSIVGGELTYGDTCSIVLSTQ